MIRKETKPAIPIQNLISSRERRQMLAQCQLVMATGGTVSQDLTMQWSTMGSFMQDLSLMIIDEGQQYGTDREIATISLLRTQPLILWTGDAQQTVGGLARAAPNAKRSRQLLLAKQHFFFLWYGRSRSKARSLHEKKLLVRKLLHGRRWSHAARQIKTTKTQTKNTRQDADPPARFASHHPKDSKANSERGKSPTRKTTKDLPRHSGKNPLCRNKLKNMQQTN